MRDHVMTNGRDWTAHLESIELVLQLVLELDYSLAFEHLVVLHLGRLQLFGQPHRYLLRFCLFAFFVYVRQYVKFQSAHIHYDTKSTPVGRLVISYSFDG